MDTHVHTHTHTRTLSHSYSLVDHSHSQHIQEMGRKIKSMGDELDGAAKEIIQQRVAEYLRNASIFKLSWDPFRSLCNSVLSSCRPLLSSGWQQVSHWGTL